MIEIRRSEERGHADFGWLDSRHTFSFGHYFDPNHMGFRTLRVVNDDRVVPGAGFGEHGHRDMEIISYVVDGALAHKDSLGNVETIGPGEVQVMTAGTGIRHSEFNGSASEGVRFLQMWVLPEREGLKPGYVQKRFGRADKLGRLALLVSRDGRDGSLPIHQDVALYAAVLTEGQAVRHAPAAGRHLWVQVVRGGVELNGTLLREGDGAAVSDEDAVTLTGLDTESEVLVYDLA
ncbi:pirin family protein [Caenispirillum bisanense]|uniref:Pirin N-terminal domain-containing protein n=1 Tax=Caenispirillum bisanense TaxID=414052 RepID=A0A286GZR3_9PROT|nr:pirin family protein [Caenispirillum bisanense]SOE00997.1 hypothetical protein SAMN05421508_11548 [Caenispirillum bisanense]